MGAHYRGWAVVAAATLGLACCTIPLIMGSFGVFLTPLAEEFGWSRAAISGALAAHTLASVIAAPFAGRLVDRFGARRVAALSFLAFSAALAAHAALSDNIAHLYLLYAATAILGAGCSPVAFTKPVAAWFNKRRGIALGIALSGVGLGAIITPLLAQFVVEQWGWRVGYLALAISPALIGAPAAYFFLREAPAARDREAAAREGLDRQQTQAGVTLGAALRGRVFWQVGLAFCLIGAGYTGVASHLMPSLTDAGMTMDAAARTQALIGVAVILGRLCTGFLLDRLFAGWVAGGAALLLALGVYLLLNAPLGPGVWIGAALLGLAAGAEIDVLAYLVGRYYGQRCFATLYGSLQACYSFGVAFGPIAVGAIRDAAGSYQPVTPLVLVLLIGASLILMALPRRRFDPAEANMKEALS